MMEPTEERPITSLLSQHLGTGEHFGVRSVLPQRTFWEKAFLLHELFQKPVDKIDIRRMSRHWYDLHRLFRPDHHPLIAVLPGNFHQHGEQFSSPPYPGAGVYPTGLPAFPSIAATWLTGKIGKSTSKHVFGRFGSEKSTVSKDTALPAPTNAATSSAWSSALFFFVAISSLTASAKAR